MKALELQDLGKSYSFGGGHEVQVLKGLNGLIPAEGTVSIRGSSGSGKTTLLNVLGGLVHPTKGRLLWQGEPVYEQGREGLMRWRRHMTGFIFQSYHLMPELNVLENVLLPAWFQRVDRRERAEELIEQVGLKDRSLHRPGELSGGEQQRVAIARALINDPALILADEPTGNLDAATSASVLNLLLDLTVKNQKALILVTHDELIADRMAVRYRLTEGKLEKIG